MLRDLRIDDLDALITLQRAGAVVAMASVFPQETHPFPAERVRDRWVAEIADPGIDCFAVTGADGSVQGFAATRGSEFLHFGTAIGTWGTGLAGSAHDEVVAQLRARGHPRAWLRVFAGNERAVRFYSRRGWTPTGLSSHSSFPPHPVLLEYALPLS